MRESEYRNWLRAKITSAPVDNYVKRCLRVEDNLHIDLDDEFQKDGGKQLLEDMTYTTDDQLHGRPLKCKIFFNPGADLRNGMGSLKTSVKKYFEFCRTTR